MIKKLLLVGCLISIVLFNITNINAGVGLTEIDSDVEDTDYNITNSFAELVDGHFSAFHDLEILKDNIFYIQLSDECHLNNMILYCFGDDIDLEEVYFVLRDKTLLNETTYNFIDLIDEYEEFTGNWLDGIEMDFHLNNEFLDEEISLDWEEYEFSIRFTRPYDYDFEASMWIELAELFFTTSYFAYGLDFEAEGLEYYFRVNVVSHAVDEYEVIGVDIEDFVDVVSTHYDTLMTFDSANNRYVFHSGMYTGERQPYNGNITAVYYYPSTQNIEIRSDNYFVSIGDDGSIIVDEIMFSDYEIEIYFLSAPPLNDPSYTIDNVTEDSITITIHNDNPVEVAYSGEFTEYINGSPSWFPISFPTFTIPADGSITHTFTELNIGIDYILFGYFSDNTNVYSNSETSEIIASTEGTATVLISYNESMGQLFVNGDLVPDGTIIDVDYGLLSDTIIEFEAIEGYKLNRYILTNVDGTNYIKESTSNPYELTLMYYYMESDFKLTVETSVDLNAFHYYYSHTFIPPEYHVTGMYHDFEPSEYFTKDRLMEATIFINGTLVVDNGIAVYQDFSYSLHHLYNTHDTAFKMFRIRDMWGHTLFTIQYVTHPIYPESHSIQQYNYQGRVMYHIPSNNIVFESPITIEIYLPNESLGTGFTPPTEGDTLAPESFFNFLDIISLNTPEGLFIFSGFTIIGTSIGVLALGLGSSTALIVSIILIALFLFMNLLPLWANLLLMALIAYTVIAMIRGRV